MSEGLLAEAGQPTEHAREVFDQVVEGTAEQRFLVGLILRNPVAPTQKRNAVVIAYTNRT